MLEALKHQASGLAQTEDEVMAFLFNSTPSRCLFLWTCSLSLHPAEATSLESNQVASWQMPLPSIARNITNDVMTVFWKSWNTEGKALYTAFKVRWDKVKRLRFNLNSEGRSHLTTAFET